MVFTLVLLAMVPFVSKSGFHVNTFVTEFLHILIFVVIERQETWGRVARGSISQVRP
jgi:hypothetical protein